MGLGIVVIEGFPFPQDDTGASDRPRGAPGGLTCETAKPGGHSSERAVKVLFRTKGAGASDDLFRTPVNDSLMNILVVEISKRQ